MSVYRGQEKVLNSITAVEEAKVKEIVGNEITTKGVCTTKVADVSKTNITNFSSNYTSGSVAYIIKNGMCHVGISGLKLKSTGYNLIICDGMPKPALGFVDVVAETDGVASGNIMIGADGKLSSHYLDAKFYLYCSFSYPVAES